MYILLYVCPPTSMMNRCCSVPVLPLLVQKRRSLSYTRCRASIGHGCHRSGVGFPPTRPLFYRSVDVSPGALHLANRTCLVLSLASRGILPSLSLRFLVPLSLFRSFCLLRRRLVSICTPPLSGRVQLAQPCRNNPQCIRSRGSVNARHARIDG